MRREGSIIWSARYLELTSLVFILWGQIKTNRTKFTCPSQVKKIIISATRNIPTDVLQYVWKTVESISPAL